MADPHYRPVEDRAREGIPPGGEGAQTEPPPAWAGGVVVTEPASTYLRGELGSGQARSLAGERCCVGPSGLCDFSVLLCL